MLIKEKTKFWELCTQWMVKKLSELTWLHCITITKLKYKNNNVNFNSKFEVFIKLRENFIISNEMILPELF